MLSGLIERDIVAPSYVYGDGGLMVDALVMTLRGEVAAAKLKDGDRVITRDAGAIPIAGIRRRKAMMPKVSIKAGSLGHTRPDKDTVLPAGTRIHVRDWRAEAMFGEGQANVAAGRLVDGEFIEIDEVTEVETVQILLDTDHILYVDGLEVFCPTAL